ncbi:hypothetical protein D3C75_591760 [compost metagenome]
MYVIKYEYYWYEEGCGCCSSSESTIEIYENRLDAYMSSFGVPLMGDEAELRDYINDCHPEYNGFVVHEDTRWF